MLKWKWTGLAYRRTDDRWSIHELEWRLHMSKSSVGRPAARPKWLALFRRVVFSAVDGNWL